MDKLIAKADKEVLVEIIRFSQKHGFKGDKGEWKDFLEFLDKGNGSGPIDPARRHIDVLIAFLETFKQEKDRTIFCKMIRRQADHASLRQYFKEFPDPECLQQRLVRMTVMHPQYARSYCFPCHQEDWLIIPLGNMSKAMKSKKAVSIDCEMVLCEDGSDAVVRVCAVDQKLEVKLDKVVNPNKPILDYRTDITGMTAKDLEGVTCSLEDIQKLLKKLLSPGTVLVGHSLYNDLKALKIDYPWVIETAFIFKYKDLPITFRPSLNNLCKSVLGHDIRNEGEAHNCLNDAEAAMKLVLAKLEHGFDDPIAIAGKKLSDSDLAKLLLHNVPVEVPCQYLRNIFHTEYDIDIQEEPRIRGQSYSTFVVFKDAKEADAAYDGIAGQEFQDYRGRLQKLVSLKLIEGQTISFFIRKMTSDSLPNGSESTKKRSTLEDFVRYSKKQKLCSNQCDHVKEVERLKKAINDSEEEIFNLQRVLAALITKQEL